MEASSSIIHLALSFPPPNLSLPPGTSHTNPPPPLNSIWFLTIDHFRTRTLALNTNVAYFQQFVCHENCLSNQNSQLLGHNWYIHAESYNSNTDSISKVIFHRMAAWAGWNVLFSIVFFSHCDGSITILHCAVKNENSGVFDTLMVKWYRVPVKNVAV